MSRLSEKTKKDKIFSVVLTVLIAAFLGLVFYINLSCNPEYYDSDMYGDIAYAKEAWEAKSLFPQGWLFGNQTYIAATPVLAAVIYGMIHNSVLAMGIASCIMYLFIVFSFNWMMKPVFSYVERASGLLLMVAAVILRGNMATSRRGAQILFTMASYYSCYIITAFLVYGCYIRLRRNEFKKRDIPIAVIAVALSFAMGMQSLRQTAIMTLPLIVCEMFLIVFCSIRDKKQSFSRSTIFTVIVSAANIAGLVAMRFIDVQQTTIYGEAEINLCFSIKNIISEIISCFIYNIIGSLNIAEEKYYLNYFAVAVFILTILSAFVICLIELIKSKGKNTSGFTLELLLVLSCASVFAIDVLTAVECKTIYFFMIYPLLGQSLSVIIRHSGKFSVCFNSVMAVAFAGLMAFEFTATVREIRVGKDENNEVYQIADYMIDNGYDTLYSVFDIDDDRKSGENVALASGDKIYLIQLASVNNWDKSPVTGFLHIKDDFKTRDNEKSLYLFNAEDMKLAEEACKHYNVEIEAVTRFGDHFLCQMSENLCAAAASSNE